MKVYLLFAEGGVGPRGKIWKPQLSTLSGVVRQCIFIVTKLKLSKQLPSEAHPALLFWAAIAVHCKNYSKRCLLKLRVTSTSFPGLFPFLNLKKGKPPGNEVGVTSFSATCLTKICAMNTFNYSFTNKNKTSCLVSHSSETCPGLTVL